MNYSTTSDGRICCADCKRWVYETTGGIVRHSGRCDFVKDRTHHTGTEAAQRRAEAVARPSATAKQIARAVREGSISAVLTDDEIVDAVRVGAISMSEAMNRDF